jgi:myosin V
LYNLKRRHGAARPYTRTGDIIIACNPYKWYHDLYQEDQRLLYAETLVWGTTTVQDARATLEPHVYETSCLAYRGLAVQGEHQSILVSGESGAGKTETVKILLSDIASVQRGRQHLLNATTTNNNQFQSPIVQRVLDSNPLLEAFGNAKTVRNDNSSRFGKYIQLQFDAEDPVQAAYAGRSLPACTLAGSKSEVYLLEKSRVCMHEADERTFHIFYQLLAAPDDIKTQFWKGLTNTTNESFLSVGYTETDTIEGKTDAERFQQTLDSLALLGIKDETLNGLMRTICIVLQLGNITFEANGTDESKSIISSHEDLAALSELFGVSGQDLLSALTIRTITARNEEFKVPLHETAAKESCDAFAKEIYAKTFLWLVRSINDATCAELNYDGEKRSDFGIIGLLDIFGFESFETNRFEQLCINYANEKLQQKFTQDVFRSVQVEYEYEGIALGEITYDDNSNVLDLVEGRLGLLAFLNEECVRPGGSDAGFVSKVHTSNKDNPCFIRENSFFNYEFGVHHYAGRVIYDATAFVTKNMDTLSRDLQECACMSANAIVAKELGNDTMMNAIPTKTKKPPQRGTSRPTKSPAPAQRGTGNLTQQTVWTKFRTQLNSLMTNLATTRTRYIRCIKPNEYKQPLVMEHLTTVEQLRCAGVVAAVTISRSAFPNRLDHKIVLDRFKSLWLKGEHIEIEEIAAGYTPEERTRALVRGMLAKALFKLEKSKDGTAIQAFVIGKTRTYFRAGALEYLESERLKGLGNWAVELQRCVRKFMARSRYLKLRTLAIRQQALIRMCIARKQYILKRTCSIAIQCMYRCVLACRLLELLKRDGKATLIQTHWRMAVAVAVLKKYLAATIAVQRIARGSLQRPKFLVALHEKKEEAKLENQVLALQRKLEEAESRRIEAEKKAEERAQHAVQVYRERAFEEKKDGSDISSVSHSPSGSVADGEGNDDGDMLSPSPVQLSAQQQALMDESGKMLEYLRKEVFKLRSQNAAMRNDFDLLKDNNQRLMDANASAGASFAALNQHTKQLSRANDKLVSDLNSYKQQVQKLSVTQVELREELKMKQATYIAEVHSRLQYQKALSRIVDLAHDRCRDHALVEDMLKVADTCEAEYLSGPTGLTAGSGFFTPKNGQAPANGNPSPGLLSSFRNLW